MHRWLLANHTFGPMVRHWEEERCISCRVKVIAITSMLLVGGISIFAVLESNAWRIAGGLLLAIGAAVVAAISSCKEKAG